VIDLVRDQPHPRPAAPDGDRGEPPGLDQRARGVGRARDDEPVDRARQRVELRDGRLKPVPGLGRDRHHLDVEGLQDVAVGGIAGLGHGHPGTCIERREKGQDEGTRRPHRDGDPLDRHIDAISPKEMPRYGPAQCRKPESLAIAKRPAIQRRPGSLDRRRRRPARRLAHLEMQTSPPRGSA
jgi:hypothetical protein